MTETIFVNDPCKPTISYRSTVLETREITEGCTAYLVQLTDAESVDTIPVIVYADGYQFTPRDWQAGYHELPDDLSDIFWVSQGGAEAVMMDGLPRVFGDMTPAYISAQKFETWGYDSIEKSVGPGNITSSRVNLPADWRGKRVRIIRLDP